MYRITCVSPSEQTYRIEHFVKGDPSPTPTARTAHGRPQAFQDAYGAAAKQSVITGKPQHVITDDGIVFEITGRRIAGLSGCCMTAHAMHAIKCPVCQRSASTIAETLTAIEWQRENGYINS